MLCRPPFESRAVPLSFRDFKTKTHSRIQAKFKDSVVIQVLFLGSFWRRDGESSSFVDVFFPDLFRTASGILVDGGEASSNQSHRAECNSEIRAHAHKNPPARDSRLYSDMPVARAFGPACVTNRVGSLSFVFFGKGGSPEMDGR